MPEGRTVEPPVTSRRATPAAVHVDKSLTSAVAESPADAAPAVCACAGRTSNSVNFGFIPSPVQREDSELWLTPHLSQVTNRVRNQTCRLRYWDFFLLIKRNKNTSI